MARPRGPTDEVPFDLHLAGSGDTVHVPAGHSTLSALEEAGVPAPSTCREGTCGSCEVRLLPGRIDHRDSLLTRQERERGDIMPACVSQATEGALVVDL
jgi:ferredoxin